MVPLLLHAALVTHHLASSSSSSSSTSSIDIVAWVVVPLIIFILGASATGITLLIKGSAYMARSQVAQENTATSNQEISDKLDRFISRADGRFNSLDIRMSVLEAKFSRDERTPNRHE
jgi:hypothetical protein